MIEIFGIRSSLLPNEDRLVEAMDSGFYTAWQTRHRNLQAPGARESLAGFLLLQAAGVQGRLAYDEFGRPYSIDADIDFNITHTGGSVFCAVEYSSAARVGIDAEEMIARKRLRADEMARRWFSADEQRLFFADPTDEGFLQIWTRKEALLKRSGEGLRAISREDVTTAEERHGVKFYDFSQDGTVITLCCDAEIVPPKRLKMLDKDSYI